MNSLDFLRSVTKPTPEAKVREIVRARCKGIRDNIGSDDPVLAEQIAANRTRISARREAEKTCKQGKAAYV